MRLLAIAASLRQASLNRKLLHVAVDVASRRGAEVDERPFAEFEFPYFSGDVQEATGIPEAVLRVGRLIEACDGLLLASPEYNYSMPGTLKNTIDWISRIRPVPLRGRWAFLLSASTGPIGGIRGLWQLRIPLEGLGMHVYPDMYTLPHGPQAFDDAGGLRDAERRQRLETMIGGYLDVLRKARA